MKTILRVNENRDLFFQTIESIEVIKHGDIKNYTEEYKKHYFDLGNTGNMQKITFDHETKSIFLDRFLNSWSIDCPCTGQIQERDFTPTNNAIKQVKRINKAMDYCCLLNDVEVLKQLLKQLRVQAIFIEYQGNKNMYLKNEFKTNINDIYENIVNGSDQIQGAL